MKTDNIITNIAHPDKINLVKDSLIEDYLRYVDYLERHEWTRESITITEILSAIVTITKLKAGNNGTVIDIRCPAGLITSIQGKEYLSNNEDIEKVRPLEIRLTDSNGNDLHPDTNIDILKHALLKKDIQIEHVLYRDISMTNYSNSPNLFKDYSELYRFKKGIEIKGEDSLRLYVINPNIDIDNIKFNFGVDLWTRFSDSYR